MTLIQMLTQPVSISGDIKPGWREWSSPRKKKRSLRKVTKSKNFFSLQAIPVFFANFFFFKFYD